MQYKCQKFCANREGQEAREAPTRAVAHLGGLALGLLPGALALGPRLSAALLRRAGQLRRGGESGAARGKVGGRGQCGGRQAGRAWCVLAAMLWLAEYLGGSTAAARMLKAQQPPPQTAGSAPKLLRSPQSGLAHLSRLLLGGLPCLRRPLSGGASGLADALRRAEGRKGRRVSGSGTLLSGRARSAAAGGSAAVGLGRRASPATARSGGAKVERAGAGAEAGCSALTSLMGLPDSVPDMLLLLACERRCVSGRRQRRKAKMGGSRLSRRLMPLLRPAGQLPDAGSRQAAWLVN